METMEVVEIGSEVMVLDVPKEKIRDFNTWLEDFSWGSGVGFSLFPTKEENKFTLIISSSFSHTWRQSIFPELKEFWKDYEFVSLQDNPDFLYD